MRLKKAIIAGILLPVVLAIAFLVYRPGLTGGFLFDDYPTLTPIGDLGGIHDTRTLWRYLAGGETGPLGRPITLLTFVMNDQDWPSDPRLFLLTNLLLHLLNGVLICWLALKLARIKKIAPGDDALLAVLASSLWVLHPLLTSSVLFVVQRMTELMAAFTLAGLVAFTHGRQLLVTRPTAGYIWMTAAIAVGGTLATLSKENGVLLPIYALTLEHLFFRPAGLRKPILWGPWALVFLYLPLLALVGYVAFTWNGVISTYRMRDFTLTQRLLSEARILVDYLRAIVAPYVGESGLFHDDFVASKDLLHPMSTFYASLLLTGLLALSWITRRRFHLASFALIWFFAGQLLESTVLPLELYFEHRNYLPMAGIVFGLAYLVITAKPKLKIAALGGISVFLVFETFLTFQNAQVWGNGLYQSEIWSNEHPRSLRAQQLSARFWTAKGEFLKARTHILAAIKHHPDNIGLRLQLIQNGCNQGDLNAQIITKELGVLSAGRPDNSTLDTAQKLVGLIQENSCPKLSIEQMHVILSALMKNPNCQTKAPLAHLYFIQASLYYLEANLQGAINSLDRSFVLVPNVDVALNAAYWLASAGLFHEAMERVALANTADQAGTTWHHNLRRNNIEEWDKYIRNLESLSTARKQISPPVSHIPQSSIAPASPHP